jgi:hypothetical protein
MEAYEMNWEELASTSHYQTAVAVEKELRQGRTAEATAGVQELIEALARSEKRALKSYLVRLMLHILKWKCQPELRNRSWAASIQNSRDEIADIQQETPSLTDDVIKSMWDKCLQAARRDAEADMDAPCSVTTLSWQEAFEEAYQI